MAITSANNLRKGSTGGDVLELQKKLNQTGYGYNLAEDGSFGNNTLSAVKDYQQRSGLDVDGVVGTHTWGALTKANASATTTPTQATTPTATQTPASETGGFTYKPYQKSDVVTQAEEMLRQQLSQKPGEYQSAWQTQLDDTLNKILNREKFSYDLNGDALYQQYKDQYMLQGQQAMMDTMGQAQAMTGGYGNSYAQTVGQQTYQGYLQQLNDKVPELYQLALDQYNREGQDLYNQYGLYADRDALDYGRYRDQVGDYYTEMDRLTQDARYQSEQDYGRYTDDRNFDYGQYRDQIGDQQWREQFDYGKERDKTADEQWREQFDYGKERDKVGDEQWREQFEYGKERDKTADEQWREQFDEAKRQYDQDYALQEGKTTGNGGSPGGNGDKGNTGGSYTKNPGWDEAKIKEFQTAKGIKVDGKWGPETAGEYDKDPNWTGGGGDPTGFTGTTYSEAVAFANANGVPNSKSSTILTKSEFNRVKRGGGTRDGANEFDTYEEYLAYAVGSMIDAYGNK